jgi:hypothetical protein
VIAPTVRFWDRESQLRDSAAGRPAPNRHFHEVGRRHGAGNVVGQEDIVTAIFTFLIQLALLLSPTATKEHRRPLMVVDCATESCVGITIADGSVWADVGADEPGGFALRSTERLRDYDPATRWMVSDVDGDGRQDLVAVRFDGLASSVEVWHNGADGFARSMASPRQLIRPAVHALGDALAELIGLPLPSA